MLRLTDLAPFTLIAAILLVPGAAHGLQASPDTSAASARKAFDFLIGTWTVESMTDSGGETTPGRGEIYWFEKQLGGVLLVGHWHFNRGTTAQPDLSMRCITPASTTPGGCGPSITSARSRPSTGPGS